MKSFIIKSLSLFCLLIYTSSMATARIDDTKPIMQFIDSNAEKVLNIINNKTLRDNEKLSNLTTLFLQVVDVDWMARFALGKYWNQLSFDQQQAYLEAYQQYIISLYVPKFKKYNEHVYTVNNVKELNTDQYLVEMVISDPTSKTPISVNYRLKQTADSFWIRDIIAEGISLLSTQRSDFGAVLTKGNISTLIALLKEKAQNV